MEAHIGTMQWHVQSNLTQSSRSHNIRFQGFVSVVLYTLQVFCEIIFVLQSCMNITKTQKGWAFERHGVHTSLTPEKNIYWGFKATKYIKIQSQRIMVIQLNSYSKRVDVDYWLDDLGGIK